MLISDGKYLKPSKQTRVLAILDSLADNSGMSQFELGRRLNLSGAMVNQYLKRMQQEQLVEFFPVNGKSYRYVLTGQGEEQLRSLFSDYSCETIQLYTSVKNYILEKLKPLVDGGKRKVALFGASETCEVVLSALRDAELSVIVLLDNDPGKHGQIFHGHVICAPGMLEQVECDAVIVTSFRHQREISEQLKPLSEKKGFDIVRL